MLLALNMQVFFPRKKAATFDLTISIPPTKAWCITILGKSTDLFCPISYFLSISKFTFLNLYLNICTSTLRSYILEVVSSLISHFNMLFEGNISHTDVHQRDSLDDVLRACKLWFQLDLPASWSFCLLFGSLLVVMETGTPASFAIFSSFLSWLVN